MLSPELKTAFVAKLRSGEFNHIRGQLKDDCNGRCALGVLAEVAGIPFTELSTIDELGHTHGYQGFRRLGLSTVETTNIFLISDRNDATFEDVAQHVEANL